MTIRASDLVSDYDFTEDPDAQQRISQEDRARTFVHNRQLSYQQVFNVDTPAGFAVLADLAHFCRGNRTAFDPNPYVMAGLNGQREVWLRILQNLSLTDEQLTALYRKGEGR